MILDWESLAATLRWELQEYGGLLNLFDEQEAAILHDEPDALRSVLDSIAQQARTIYTCRKQRESLVQQCATIAIQPKGSPLSSLLAFFKDPIQPLLKALIEEVNHLIVRTKKRARQNQMLLTRSMEVSQKIGGGYLPKL